MSDFLAELRRLSPKQLMLLAYEQHELLEAAARREPVAIIGIGCRFPGADSEAAFWRVLDEGRDAIGDVPADRWDSGALFDPNPDAPGRLSVRRGGFLDGIADFDAGFFGIAPREARSMDPQQRLLLETAWEALENAGLPPDRLADTQTGVFVGQCNADYLQRLLWRGDAAIDGYFASGTSPSVTSGRLAFCLGLRGPAITVDTSCSSSLVALHLACRSLRAGETRLALAAGVNLICAPEATIAMSKAHMLAPDGRCKAFDAAADGLGRGEGCAVLVLKRLSDAQADGDPILALVRGSAINQDGRSAGLTVPSGPAQEAVIAAALADAGVAAAEIAYVEAHGTGTKLGDPIEVRALGNALRPGGPGTRPLLIGSVKSNIGHLEAAAGLAGVVKTVLCLQHARIPPQPHFQTPSPHIPWAEIGVAVAKGGEVWPAGGTRKAGVSSFGFSGTNAHVVLEQAPVPAESPGADNAAERLPIQCLPLSARSAASLRDLAVRYAVMLEGGANLAEVARDAAVGRSHHAIRLAVLAGSEHSAADALRAYASGRTHLALLTDLRTVRHRPSGGIVFLFPGNGHREASAWRGLYEASGIVRGVIDRADAAVGAGAGGRGLIDLLDGAAAADRKGSGRARGALCAAQCAAAALWRAFGIEPAAVVGEDAGELAAACVAGVLTLEDAVRLAANEAAFAPGPVPMRPPAIPVAWSHPWKFAADPAGEAGQWWRQQPAPERFDDAVVRLHRSSHEVFLDMGPEPTLLARCRAVVPADAAILAGTGAPGAEPWRAVTHALAQLYVCGAAIDWRALSGARGAARLPTYPFDRQRYWVDIARPARQPVQSGTLEEAPGDGPVATGTSSADGWFYEILWRKLPPVAPAAAALVSPDRFMPAVCETFAALAGRHGLDVHDRLAPVLHRLSGLHVAEALRKLGFDDTPRRLVEPAREAALLGVHPQHRRLFGRMLDMLVEDGVLRPSGGGLSVAARLPQGNTDSLHEDAAAAYGIASGPLRMLRRCASGLAPVLTGALDPLALLFPGGRFDEAQLLYADSPMARTYNGALASAALAAIAALPQGARLRVIEIGGGTAGTTQALLPVLPPDRLDYTFTDVSRLFLNRAAKRFPNLRTGLLDIERDPASQGYAAGAYDLVVAANVLHATADLARTAGHVRSLLAQGGLLLCLEAVRPERWTDLTFGMTEGWWRVADTGLRPSHPLAPVETWRRVLAEAGLTQIDTIGGGQEAAPGAAQQALLAARAPVAARRWTLLGNPEGLGTALAERLGARGDTVTVLGLDADVDAFTGGNLVYLGALTLGAVASAASCLELACAVPMRWLARSGCAPAGEAAAGRVWLVTSGAQPVLGNLGEGGRFQAPLWGVGRVFALEQPARWGGLIDLPPDEGMAARLDALLAALDGDGDEDQIAYRNGDRYVARLERARPPAASTLTMNPDGTYLVAGGFGGLGLLVGRWLAERGARHIALLGRNADGDSAGVRAIEAAGARVIPLAADIADIAALRSALDRLAATAPPLRGLIHTATAVSLAPIADLTLAQMAEMFRPKVAGLMALEQALPPLDFTVLFSSTAALTGAACMAHYAAANAFLDATAQLGGRRVLSVNWGSWETVRAASAADLRRLRDGGLLEMTTTDALAALERLIAGQVRQMAVARIDWSRLKPLHERARPRPLLASLGAEPRQIEPAPVLAAPALPLLERLAAGSADTRADILEAFVRQAVAEALGMPDAASVPPEAGLFELGMDSLMAVALQRALEQGAGRKLPATLTFNYPNAAVLARYLGTVLDLSPPPSEATDTGPAEVLGPADIDALSDAEIERRLRIRLEAVG